MEAIFLRKKSSFVGQYAKEHAQKEKEKGFFWRM